MPTKKKTSRKKSPVSKPVKKTTARRKTKTSKGSHEHKVASSALKLVDEAATLLRKGIKNTASTTEKSRLAAKKKAHTLLTKASSSLSGIFSGGTSALHKAISKL